MEQPTRSLEDNMHKRPGEEDEEAQRVDNNRDMDTDQKTTERENN